MTSSLPSAPAARQLASVLRWAALALVVLCLSNVLLQVLPPIPTDPLWQLSFGDSLITQSPLLVLGLCLQLLAGRLAAGSPRAQRLERLSQQLALPLAIGVLLLIPLQGFAAWTAWQNDSRSGAAQAQRLRRGLEQLRRDTNRAGSEAELAALLRRLPAGGPALASLGPDLPSQRRQMLRGLEQASLQIDSALRARRRQGLQSGIRRFVRLLVACLALAALGLAAAGRRLGWLRIRNPAAGGLRLWPFRIGRRRPVDGSTSSRAYLRRLARHQQRP